MLKLMTMIQKMVTKSKIDIPQNIINPFEEFCVQLEKALVVAVEGARETYISTPFMLQLPDNGIFLSQINMIIQTCQDDPREIELHRIYKLLGEYEDGDSYVWPRSKFEPKDTNKFYISVRTGFNNDVLYYENKTIALNAKGICDIYRKCFFDMYSKYIVDADKAKHIIQWDQSVVLKQKAYFTFTHDDIVLYDKDIDTNKIVVNTFESIIKSFSSIRPLEKASFKEIHALLYSNLQDQILIESKCKHEYSQIENERKWHTNDLAAYKKLEYKFPFFASLADRIMYWYRMSNRDESCEISTEGYAILIKNTKNNTGGISNEL